MKPTTTKPGAVAAPARKDREALRRQYTRMLAKLHEAEDRLDRRRARLSVAFRAAFERTPHAV